MFEFSETLTAFLLSQSVFTDVMEQRLSPIVSSVDEVYPFTNYVIQEQTGQSKDASAFTATLLFYFEKEGYAICAQFLDSMKPIIEENYDWQSSNIEFVEQDQSFVGIINFNKL